MSRSPRRFERLVLLAAWLCCTALLAYVGALIGYLVWNALPALGPALLFGDVPAIDALTGRRPVWDGILPAMAGTLAVVLLANLFAQPVGVATGIYIAEYLSGRLQRAALFLVGVLAGIPSIVIGLFGFAFILVLRATLAPHANTSMLLSAGCLALLVLPYVVNTTVVALMAVPRDMRVLGPSLGFTRWQSLHHVLLPACRRGILGGSVLAIGRTSEDVAVIMLTGAVASSGMPAGLTAKFEALPFYIFYRAAENRGPDDLARAFGAALLLVMMAWALFSLAGRLLGRIERKDLGRS